MTPPQRPSSRAVGDADRGEVRPRATRQDPDFGDFVREDDQAFCAQDRRFAFGVVGSDRAVVPVIRVDSPTSLAGEMRQMLGLSEIDRPASLIGGGVGHFWSAAWSREIDAHGHLHAIRPLVRSAVRQALTQHRHVVAPSVDAEDLAAFLDVPGVEAMASSAPPHFVLHLGGARTMTALIEGLPKKARQTWRRDRHSDDAHGFSAQTSMLTAQDCAEMADAVVATSRRNGVQEHAMIAEWRLSGFLERPGRHSISRIRRDGATVAYACWTDAGSSIVAHTFAVADTVVAHREAYHHAFRAAVEYALHRGADRILFGAAHSRPKLARGCLAEPKWSIRYQDEIA